MAVTDLTFLHSFAGGNAERVKKYINLFLQYAPTMMGNMEQQLASRDYATLKTTAHALKPQITYMGIKTAEELIRQIEIDAGEQKNLGGLGGQLERLKTILDQAYSELKGAVENS